MEGDGEGLVAIVQGLDPAGVTVTVCNRSRHNSDRRRSSKPRIQMNAANTRSDMAAIDQRSHTLPANSAPLANERSSVETSTGTDFSRQHTSSQICDGRYASSYKLAHCMVTPTSPPEAVSEFPPQRKEPCRSQGNFEIGGHGSGQCDCHSNGKVRVSTSRVKHYAGSQMWSEKGSSHRYSKSNRETEAFAHSLRKYPSMAPFRTASTDLIEKLIRYTQAKNFQEISRTTKSMRSLRQQKSSDTYEMARASKHQQTYTRKQDYNVVNNNNVQVGYRGRVRKFKLYSPMSDSRNLKETRRRESAFSSSYDYLKAAHSPNGQSNRSNESQSPVGSSSPERTKSPERSRSPEEFKSPEVTRSPGRFNSTDGFRSPDMPNCPERLARFERSVRDLSLSDMSKYIRSTVRQICNERPVVLQVCPKLKNRFNQHKKVCPSNNDRSSDVMEDAPEEEQASGSVLSRLIQSFSGCAAPSTEQAGCQCTRTDCYCTKATQCVNNPDASTNTTSCSCKTLTITGCCRGMSCVCANKAQDQAYYNNQIDEEISEWLKDVPVHSIEDSDSKKKRETVIKELRKMLKRLHDDGNFDDNARNEIKSFIDDFPLWNPGKDKKDKKLFKNQLADKLTERILSVPRKPDRFRDIVKKWVANMDFEDDGENVDKETIIGKFVSELKSLAADRPACDIKYTHTLRRAIIELLVELALKFDGDMVKLKKVANKLATEIVTIPRNVNLSGVTTDLTDEFEENVCDWICEHGLCRELKKDPKLIEGLAKKLNKLKSQGIDDECVVEKMKEEIHQFGHDVGIAIETMDELIDELMTQLSNTVQSNEMERLDQDELTEVFIDWLSNLPGASDLHPRKFEKIVKELVNVIIEGREQGNEDLTNDILNYLVDADLSMDPADLGIYVKELMEKLNSLPSNKYLKEKLKKAMIKDVFYIVENLSITQDKKTELRNKAEQVIENHLYRSALNCKKAHDDVKEAIMDDMDDIISSIYIPKKSRSILMTSLGSMLNSNLDKSLMRLRRVMRDGSNLKQTIAKDVRNAVKELPIHTDKKKELLQQVKGILSKNMHKPLPTNVKSTINDEISDIVERCPISEDKSIVGCLKKMLSAVASKHLNICLPKCVCDIQSNVEKNVGIVIDRSAIDTRKKKELKKSIQDILTENQDRHLSDEVLRVIKKYINCVVSNLSIPEDKKDVLKMTVGETISKDFNEALSNLRHDLNKIRNKLFEDICNVIEKSPIPRFVKTHLINKLKSVLDRNLDSPLSNEEKYTILDDVSNIVKDDMPEEKRRKLTNKLAKKLDIQQRKEDINETDQLTRNLKQLQNKLLKYILREMEQAVERAPIPREKKIEMKKRLKDITTIDYKKPAGDIAEALMDGINEILDELNLPKDKKNELISELAAAIDEYSKLLKEIKDVETKYHQTKRRYNADANGKHNKIGKGLMPIEEFDENKAKESILQGIEDTIEESAIPEEKKVDLERKLKKMATDNLKKPFSDDVLDAIKIGIADALDDLQIPKSAKNKLKRALANMTDDYLDNFREAKLPAEEVDETLINISNENLDNLRDDYETKAKERILQGIERIIEESAIPEEKKVELGRKLEKMATDNLKNPFSDDVQDAIKIGIADTLDDLQIPKAEKNKLKLALTNMTDDYLDNLRETKQPVEKVDERKAKESILQGIEKIIEESAIPEEKKMELEQKLQKMATDNLKKPFSDDVQDAIKIGIADTLDDLKIPKAEKNKLKLALTNMTDDYLDNLREAKQPVEEVDETLINISDENLRNDDETKAKERILKGIEKIIEKSAIPEEKKMEFKKKLKKIATNNLKTPLSDDVLDAIKTGIADTLDDLQIPISEKSKLKRALTNMTDDYLDNLREAKQPVEEVDETLINMSDENFDNLGDVDKTKTKKSILQGIEKIIEESAIPEEKKVELERELKKMVTDNLKKPLSDDMLDAIKIGIADTLDDLQIPKSAKHKLKRALTNMTDDYLDNLREARQSVEEVDETLINMSDENLDNLQDDDKTKAKERILQEIEKIIEKVELKRKLENIPTDNLKKPFRDDVLDAIKIGIADIIDELQIPKLAKNKLKRAIVNMTDDYLDNLREATEPVEEVDEILINISDGNLDNLRDDDETKAKERILQGIEDTIEESAIPEAKKVELERKLKKMATDNLKKSLSDDVLDAIKIGIADTLDDVQIPKSAKHKLKRALTNMTDDYLDDFREEKQPAEEVDETLINISDGNLYNLRDDDETKAKERILEGIEKIIEESAIPEHKKMELKRKLQKIATDNLKKPLSNDVQDAIKIGIADILDELQILKSEIILQGIEKTFEKSALPEEKKVELKRKLIKMPTDNLKKPFSDDVQDAIKIGIADTLDGLQIPKAEKNKLKRALKNITDKNFSKLQGVLPKFSTRVNDLKKLQNETLKNMLLGFGEAIDQAPIPIEKNKEFRKKLKDMATRNFQKLLSDDVAESFENGIYEIIDELNSLIDKTNKLKVENFPDTKQVKSSKSLMPIEETDETNTKEIILQGIEKFIEESAIPVEKKIELKRKFKKMATDNLKKPFSDDVQDVLKIDIVDILDELQIPKSEKNKLKRELINMTDNYLDNLRETKQVRPLKSQMPMEEVDKAKAKERIFQGIEQIVEESAIPGEKKMELKKKLKKNTADYLKKTFTDDVYDGMKMAVILDELQILNSEKNKLKRALLNMVDENFDNLRGVPPKLSSQVDDFKELESETQNNILLGFEKAIDEAPILLEKKKEYKKKLKDMATNNFQKSLSDDTAEVLNDGLYKILDELHLPKDMKNKLKSEVSAVVDENLNNFKNEINFTKSMLGAKRSQLNTLIRRVLPQFDEAVDPSYQKQLAEEFDELLEIALMDGDFKDARRKLIKKLMREQNLSEKEASAPVDELIGRVREMALKKDMGDERYELDPSYVKTLEADINDIVNIALVGGNFEDARRELAKKLMRDQNLPVEEASGFTDELIGKAQKQTLAAKSKDKSLLHNETLAKAISEALDQSAMSKPDKSRLKMKLLSKLKQTMDKKPFINKNDLESLKSEMLKDLKKIVDVSSIPTGTRNELKSLLNKELAKTIDEIMGDYDDDEGFTKTYTKAISKAVNKSPIANLKKISLIKELGKTFDGIMDDYDGIIKQKEAFRKAINDAFDQSSLSEPDKSSLKNKLLIEMNQTVDESPNINDIGVLKAVVLKDCEKLVDASSIPIGKKNEMKLLLKEEIMDDYDDEETLAIEKSPDEDKISEYKEAFARSINDAVDQSTLSKPDKSSQKNKLLSKLNQTIDNSSHLDDVSALIAEVLKDSKKVVDTSSIPIDKKNELKSLLNKDLAKNIDVIMDDCDDEEGYTKTYTTAIPLDEIMDDEDESSMEAKLKKYKGAFARAINDAIDQSTLSKPDKSSQKIKLLSKLNQTIDNSPHLNDIVALIADILKDSKKVVDTSSIPIDKKSELKLLLQEAMAETSKEIMDDEEVSREGFTMFKNKIAENVKTWMDSLPIDLDPKVATAVAKDLANDILDRQKYLQLHPEATSTDKDEIENLKYQIFRRMKNLVEPKDIPPIVEGTEELFRMIMDIEPPPGFLKLRRSSLRG